MKIFTKICYSSAVFSLMCAGAPASPFMLQAHAEPTILKHKIHHASLEFRVGDAKSHQISGARIIVINHNGKILSTGLTDATGKWTTDLQAPQDLRFPAALGTATAIAIANGYNEQVVFEVPISDDHDVQPIILTPLQAGQRNEPTREFGMLHRHEIGDLIDHYAKSLHLKRQEAKKGELGTPPWSPEQASVSKPF